jgi:hypothetical protein
MTDEFERIWKKSGGCDLVEVLSWDFLGGTEESHENPVTIADIPIDIRSEHLNTSLKRYRYSNQ